MRMDQQDIIDWIKNIGLVVMSLFSIYKLFFEKNVNDLGLDSSKIKLLKEIQDLEEGKVRKLIADYNEIILNEAKLKTLLEEQDALIKKYRRRNKYLEGVLKRHKVSYDYNEDTGI